MQKKILMLGGSMIQVPAIICAKEKGYYVITCDYFPENQGHKISDEYHNISTTDIDSIYSIAQKLKIDGIVAYASDPAAPTAAYVAEKMELCGNPFKSIEILAKKTLFRQFLLDNNFNAPKSVGITDISKAIVKSQELKFPVMVKPDDSSGSKGVTKVHDQQQLVNALERAMEFSRNKKCIIEEFVNKKGRQIGGDAFVNNGNLEFIYIGDQYVNKNCNPFVPIALLFPSKVSDQIQNEIKKQMQRVIDILEIKNCAFNIEVMLDLEDNIYLMELGPRNGGNYIPQIIKHATGVDLVRATIETAIGEKYYEPEPIFDNNAYAYYALHSEKDGVLESIVISEYLNKFILEKYIFTNNGESILKFDGSNATLGIILLKFPSYQLGQEILANITSHINVKLK